ncbi:MAG: hypothetical protein ACFFBP_20960 [Promethearchaeota archaeon]
MEIIIQTKKNFWYFNRKGIRRVSILEHYFHLPRIKEFLRLVHPESREVFEEIIERYFPNLCELRKAAQGKTEKDYSVKNASVWRKLEDNRIL